jgi:hypothetical protein
MHDSMMAQIGIDHENHMAGNENYGASDGWVDLSHSYNSSQHQSPIYEHGGFQFMQQPAQSQGPMEPSFATHRMPQSSPPNSLPPHQQLLPLIMPSHPTWPSMLTNPANYSAPPVAIPPAIAPQGKANNGKTHSGHSAPTPRKTLTDSDRRRMCQYHEDHPSTKQTDIGGMISRSIFIWSLY